MLNNLFYRLLCRIIPKSIFCVSRDKKNKSLIEKLRSNGFNFTKFEQAIQYRPHNWKFFLQALLHRSYLQFLDDEWNSNERLEFLGDAILNLVVAEYLYKTYPEVKEGSLTKMRSRLVNRKFLAQRAKEMNLSKFLLLSTSAAQSIGSGSESITADAFESVIGALYLDGGYKAAKKFICNNLLNDPNVFNYALTDDNYKSALLEYSQALSLGIPRYSVLREDGPEHNRRFTIEVYVGEQLYGVGSGKSKKDAEQSAAANALDQLKNYTTIDNRNGYAIQDK